MEITPGQMCQDIFTLLGRVKTSMSELAESYGLTPVQVGGLYAIMNGHTTMGEVANTMNCDASNVTGIIDRLVAQKLVVRYESAEDRRTKMLKLTAKGRRVIDQIMVKLPAVLGCQNLSSAERNGLHETITKLSV